MTCGRKRQLLTDYLERVQAFAVELELHLKANEKEPEAEGCENWFRVEQTPGSVKIVMLNDAQGSNGWLLVQEARIQCDIARLALETHTTGHRC
jgi:hypothetical protein